VLPNIRFDVKDVWISGWPWRTTVVVQWVATAGLVDDDPYVNRYAVGKFHSFEGA
jgi:hypothetical protein